VQLRLLYSFFKLSFCQVICNNSNILRKGIRSVSKMDEADLRSISFKSGVFASPSKDKSFDSFSIYL